MDRGKLAESVRRVGLPLALLAATVGFALLVNHHEPIKDWLFVRYAVAWLGALAFLAGCLSSGHALVRLVLGRRLLPLFEHVAISFAAGIYVFFLGSLVGGLLGLYGRVFFFALPIVTIAIGARPSVRFARRAARHLRGAWRRSPRPSPWGLVLHGVGLVGLGALYFAILTPNNVAFDARWYHLGIAEHYAASGAVTRFPEGWFPGAVPHLASLLYAWAFQLPGGRLADRIELAAHVEFVVFTVALIGIPAIVRRLVRPAFARGAYRWAWAIRFFFPGVFLYDSSLCLGADHIASAFAAPVYLALLYAWKDLSARACVLLALALSGAVLTKYTGALLLVAPALLAVFFRLLVLAVRALRRRGEGTTFRGVLAGPLAAFVAGLVFTAPQWLKNLVWYGDPAYPVLHRLFTPRPWTPDSALRFDVGFTSRNLWPAEHSFKGLAQTVASFFTFSFIPNDWHNFHGSTPVFGSLFTLALVALVFLKETQRVWGLYGATQVGIFVWYFTNHQDRYLQAALPWMAAATAAVLALVWQRGLAARVGAVALCALQLVWGADVYFMPAHVFVSVPAKAVVELLSRSPGKPLGDRLVYSDAFVGVGRALPPHAKPLIHEWHPHLGVNAPTVADCPYHQGGISYASMPTPREVYDRLASFGVTHLVYRTSQAREPDTLAGETVFFNFVEHAAGAPVSADGWLIAPMPKTAPPPGGAPDPVLVVTCGKGLAPGLYHLADLRVPSIEKGKPAPKPFTQAGEPLVDMVPRAMAVAQDHGCPRPPAGVESSFKRAGTSDPFAIWIRK